MPQRPLPQVEQLLQRAFLAPYIDALSRPLVTQAVRDTLSELRQSEAFRQRGVAPEHIEALIARRCQQQLRQRQTRVINATGTLVHTNLGRSPLNPELWDEVRELNTGYNNLELDLATGKRGGRKGLIAPLLACLTQAEDSLVVNNNAASLFSPRRSREEAQPRLYVDRVFTANGTGTVLTGTLQQGRLKVGDKLLLQPAGREVQIRSLQAYHHRVEEIGAVCRMAIGLKKVPHEEVARGHCLTSAASQCEAATHLIVRLEEVGDRIRELRSPLHDKEVEVALGSWHGRARFVPIKDTRLARLIFADPIPCFFGQPLAIIRHGSSELLHGARILWCGDIHPARRKALHALLGELPDDLAGYNPATLQLGLNGYVLAGRFDVRPEQVTPLGDWLLDSRWLAQRRAQLLATLKNEPLSATELATRLGIALPVIQTLLLQLKGEQLVRLHHDKWQTGSGESEDDLGEEAQLVLKLVRDQGKEGYEPGKLGPGGVTVDPLLSLTLPAGLRQRLQQKGGLQKQLRNLARLKYLVQLEGPIYYDAALYNQLVEAVLAGQQVGDLIDMASLKQVTGLSRKYAIPFCLRMEMDGWVRREENDRRVLRLPQVQTPMQQALV